MTGTQQAPGTVVGDWLLPGDRETRLRVERAVHQSRADDQRPRRLRTLSIVARRALAEEVETKLRLLLGETLADLVGDGWQAHTTLRQARRRSRAQPGVDHVVTLRKHEVVTERDHSLDVQVDGVTVLTLTAAVEVGLQVVDAVAIIRNGLLLEVRSGQLIALGRVTLEGVLVTERRAVFPLTAVSARGGSPAGG